MMTREKPTLLPAFLLINAIDFTLFGGYPVSLPPLKGKIVTALQGTHIGLDFLLIHITETIFVNNFPVF